MKRIIWDSQPELSKEDISSIRADMKEMAVDNAEELTDDEVETYFLNNINPDYFDCERDNLDLTLPGKVIAIADIGRWNGRRSGYRIMENNLNEVLLSHVNGASELSVYGDGYNIQADETHHDGTNHYMYRMIRSDKDATPLLDALYYGKEVTSSLLNRYTRSLYPYVAQIYGWPCRQKVKEV